MLDALAEIDLADESEEPVTIQLVSWDAIKNHIKTEWKNFQSDKINKKEADIQERIREAEELLKKKKSL